MVQQLVTPRPRSDDSSVPQAYGACLPGAILSPIPLTIMASVGGIEQSPPPDNESGVLPLHYTSGKAIGSGLVWWARRCWWCWGSHGLAIRRRSPTCMTTCEWIEVLLPIVTKYGALVGSSGDWLLCCYENATECLKSFSGTTLFHAGLGSRITHAKFVTITKVSR